ncbi:hypothetical protein PA598K_03996 [Paenibacillus sp. 598K]|uniref:hypothetical protein n=1 Tax=Paenibacillus sp. 598K TaxID=1117987 RepID=UPI000FFA334F|nr:hypothetical protein [Paenibacillus sp. 598K]GBF75578.1 hypothetical protein PA598K_03996 [Paenibacillus sp. 598K]
MASRILPVAKPFLRGYVHHAIAFSIIDLSSESDNHWFASNFIQLRCPHDLPSNRHSTLDFYHETFYAAYDDQFTIQTIHKNVIAHYNGGVIRFLIDTLEADGYTELMVNESYIPGTSTYMKDDFTHNIFIYGYDQEASVFYGKFVKDGVFTEAQILFEALQEAYARTNGQAVWVNHSKVYTRLHNPITFDSTRFYGFLSDYVKSRSCYRDNKMYVFGLDIYDKVIEYFGLLQEGRAESDIRVLHSLWEHKQSMRYKIKFLQEAGLLDPGADTVHRLEELEGDAFKLRALHLRSFFSPDQGLYAKIIRRTGELREKEAEVYESMLSRR